MHYYLTQENVGLVKNL